MLKKLLKVLAVGVLAIIVVALLAVTAMYCGGPDNCSWLN